MDLNNDWTIFLPALQGLWQGLDPYLEPRVLNPPWTFLFLAPLGLLPDDLGRLIGFFLPGMALVWAAWRRRKAYLIAIVGLSFPFIAMSVYGNLDWFVLVGAVTQGPLSLFFLTTKPQAGALAALAQFADKTWRQRIQLVLPLAVVGVLMVLIFPGWLANWGTAGESAIVRYRLLDVWLFPEAMRELALRLGYDERIRNFSLFPYSAPLALPLLWLCWRRRQPLYGVLASLCLAPYFYIHSVTPALFLLADRNWKWGVAAAVGSWVIIGLIIIGLLPITL